MNKTSVFNYDDEDIGEGSGGSNEQLSDNVWAPPVFEDSVEEGEQMALLDLKGYCQNILATFVENENINKRDEQRELGQQPNFKNTYLII